MKKLPDAEFEIMKAMWDAEESMTAGQVMSRLKGSKEWKIQTLISLLNRLVERGFLRTEKRGNERFFMPVIQRDAYLRFETGRFFEQYHGGSYMSLLNTLQGKKLNDREVAELSKWLESLRFR